MVETRKADIAGCVCVCVHYVNGQGGEEDTLDIVLEGNAFNAHQGRIIGEGAYAIT